MTAVELAAWGVAGLVVGSFLNVCIHRLPRGESVVSPRSRCPGCRRTLSWWENVPVVSFLVLRGRCRTCADPISPVYPLIELATAALFVWHAARLVPGPLLGVRLVFCSMLLVLGTIDLRHRVLPNRVTLPGVACGLLASVWLEPGWRSAVAAVVGGAGGLFLLGEAYYRVRHEEGLGMGDVKMLAMIGAFLGWSDMITTLTLASLLGALVGVTMVLARLADRTYPLPFGTFLAVSGVVVSAEGPLLRAWYLGWIAP